MSSELTPPRYNEFLADLKKQIRAAQVKAALSVNRELVLLYWEIGAAIVNRQENEGWGTAILERLSRDIAALFPGIEGFSKRNLYRMRALYLAYRQRPAIVPQLVAQLPWGHNIILLEKIKDDSQRDWYISQCIEHGWSRNVLVHQIDSGLYNRQGKAQTNFGRTLPTPQTDLAQQLLKDPYTFDFLTLGDDAHERDLERGLLGHIRSFLQELGVGFAFVGSQHHLEVGGRDF